LIIGPDRAPRERFVQLTRAAPHQLRLIDAKLTDPGLLSLLASRRTAGVRVDVKGRKDLGPLTAHGKLLIVDQTTAVIGSIALRAAAFQSGRELAVVIHEPAVLRQLDAFWPSLSPSYARWQPIQAVIQEIRP
jgi:phosphatidylserine/phosphatidylglycerophosphate/cardiolipin synthase-like enzyme